MSIAIINHRSSIARAFMELLPDDEEILFEPDLSCGRFLFCSGYLAGSDIRSQTRETISEAYLRNFAEIASICDLIFEHNEQARICIIGSESGYAGSHDMAYAGAKAALHLYIERKRLRAPGQQLVGIAPTIIWDSGMTQARPDLPELSARGAARRIGRWLDAAEVAAAAHFLLYGDRGYISNFVLRMNGGIE